MGGTEVDEFLSAFQVRSAAVWYHTCRGGWREMED